MAAKVRRRRARPVKRRRGPVPTIVYGKTTDGYARPGALAVEYGTRCPKCKGTKSRQALRCMGCYVLARSSG